MSEFSCAAQSAGHLLYQTPLHPR